MGGIEGVEGGTFPNDPTQPLPHLWVGRIIVAGLYFWQRELLRHAD
jgi:hypothetical protein